MVRRRLPWCALGVALTLAGCGGGGCLLDSDCRSFQEVCLERQCVPVGTMLDGGPRDAATPPADGGRDAGPPDAGPPDAGPPDGGPMCEDVTGSWAVAAVAGACGAALEGHGVTVTAGASPCELVAVSLDAQPALDGTFNLSEAGFLDGTLGVGGELPDECTGTYAEGVLRFTCGACLLNLARL